MNGTTNDVAARVALEEALRGKPTEPDLQRLLNKHLRVLAYGLPVRVREAAIEIRGRPGLSEADYVFVDHHGSEVRYGVIELKSPRHRVVRQPRKGVYALTASATTAVQQAQVYGEQLQRRLQAQLGIDARMGTTAEMYVVMGRSCGLDAELLEGLDRATTQRLFPADVRFVTYDSLLARFVERCGSGSRSGTGRTAALTPWALRIPIGAKPLRDENRLVEGVAPSVLDQFRASRFSDISIYAREWSASSASEFDGDATRDDEPQFVYLLFGEGRIWMLDVGAGLVTRMERYHASDELLARREFAAGPLRAQMHGEFKGAGMVVPWSERAGQT